MSTGTLTQIMVCSATELTPGKRKVVTIDNQVIVVVNSHETLYAFQSRCPHQGAPLEFGSISGAMKDSDPHQYEYGCHNQVIRCPLHGWGFDMETGQSLFSSKVKIKTYEVKEENESIVLYVNRKPTKVSVTDLSVGCS
ncbi:Rieske (2Fe-2S) protein [Neobacillus drentensis]|jgi:nitrite reductase (NADH) small subunit|uniref:Rieske (2Fe-2S) protein n=1 Tax=Neobacillus drentensis TaxID=220684 RepID=UPI002FFFF9A3